MNQHTVTQTVNPMRNIFVSKVTLNIGAGISGEQLEKATKLLGKITGVKAVETATKKRIPTWNLRPGLKIGAKTILRDEQAVELLGRLLKANGNKLKESQFDNTGNVAFGVPEYIDIPGVKYEADIGIMGLEVAVTMERPGYHIKKRAVKKRRVGHRHQITKEEAIAFMKKTFNVEVTE